MKDDRVYLQDILDEINFLISLKPALTYEDLLHDTIKEHAVIRSLQIIGEATKKVSMSARKAHPEIPWTDMAKFRDKITHGYSDIDYTIIWDVIQVDIPEIEPKVRVLLKP